MYVLDSLANDIEDLDSILRMLNRDSALGWQQDWGREFIREEIVQALSRLIREDLVQVFVLAPGGKSLEEWPAKSLPPGDYGDVYFGLTSRGRLVHANWHPDVGSEN